MKRYHDGTTSAAQAPETEGVWLTPAEARLAVFKIEHAILCGESPKLAALKDEWRAAKWKLTDGNKAALMNRVVNLRMAKWDFGEGVCTLGGACESAGEPSGCEQAYPPSAEETLQQVNAERSPKEKVLKVNSKQGRGGVGDGDGGGGDEEALKVNSTQGRGGVGDGAGGSGGEKALEVNSMQGKGGGK